VNWGQIKPFATLTAKDYTFFVPKTGFINLSHLCKSANIKTTL
jgi:hypothetical protein